MNLITKQCHHGWHYVPKNLHKKVETLSRKDGINQSGLEGKMGSMNSDLVGDVMHDGRDLGAA